MIRINLLPTEDIPRSRTIKLPQVGAFAPLGVVAVVLAVCATTFFVQKRSADHLVHEVEVAKEETRKLAPQIARIKQLERERDQLDRRLDTISDLDRERYFRVHLMSELSRRFPENAWLTAFTELNPGSVEIKGITFNNFVVADLIRDLSDSGYYGGIDLVISKRGTIEETRVLEFTITADVSQPPADITAGI